MGIFKWIRRGITAPTPLWLSLALAASLTAGAAVPIYYGSVNVPVPGTMTVQGVAQSIGAGTTTGSFAVGGGLAANTTGTQNSAFGLSALLNGTSGAYNTAMGYQAGTATTTGYDDSFFGADSAQNNVGGTDSVALGYEAAATCPHVTQSVVIGSQAMNGGGCTGADQTVSIGYQSCYLTTTGCGGDNTIIGTQAAYSAANGGSNTIIGYQGLYNGTSANGDTGVGNGVFGADTTGYWNTAVGQGAGNQITTAYQDLALGYGATPFSNTESGDLSIQNAIYGRGNFGTGNGGVYLSTGCIGFYTVSCIAGQVDFGVPISGTTLSLSTALDAASGGTGNTGFTAGDCVRAATATQLASAAADCVTSVSASGNLTSTGGTTPTIAMIGGPTFTNLYWGPNPYAWLTYSGNQTTIKPVSASQPITFVNAANTAITMQLSDTGTLTLRSPLTISNGGTGQSSTQTVGLDIPLCYISGAVATNAPCPTQDVSPTIVGGQITQLSAFCRTADNGTTVLTLYTVSTSNVQTAVATLTLSTSYRSNASFAAIPLTSPEGLYGAITTAGTAANCAFTAEGTQQVQ